MGIYDRDYSHEGSRSGYRYAPQMRIGFPRLTPIVKKLLIINFAVFFIGIIFFPKKIGSINLLWQWFSVFPISKVNNVQIWRLITYQFLHGSFWHIIINMIGLFFLGPTLEKHWGPKRFLFFYLGCGVAGGIFYMLLVALGWLGAGTLVGASGAILGLLVACAILFPHFVVIFFIFPVPIRLAAIILIIGYSAILLSKGPNAGGHAAHLAGMAAGAAYVFSQSWRAKIKLKLKTSLWQKKIAKQKNLQVELDRILEKVHKNGIHSLTSKEKKILKQATEAEQTRNKL